MFINIYFLEKDHELENSIAVGVDQGQVDSVVCFVMAWNIILHYYFYRIMKSTYEGLTAHFSETEAALKNVLYFAYRGVWLQYLTCAIGSTNPKSLTTFCISLYEFYCKGRPG